MKASFCNMIAALYCYCGDKLIQYGLLLKHSLQKKREQQHRDKKTSKSNGRL